MSQESKLIRPQTTLKKKQIENPKINQLLKRLISKFVFDDHLKDGEAFNYLFNKAKDKLNL